MKETIAPTNKEKTIENPIEIPSIFIKNKSSVIILGLRFVKINKKVTRRARRMK